MIKKRETNVRYFAICAEFLKYLVHFGCLHHQWWFISPVQAMLTKQKCISNFLTCWNCLTMPFEAMTHTLFKKTPNYSHFELRFWIISFVRDKWAYVPVYDTVPLWNFPSHFPLQKQKSGASNARIPSKWHSRFFYFRYYFFLSSEKHFLIQCVWRIILRKS